MEKMTKGIQHVSPKITGDHGTTEPWILHRHFEQISQFIKSNVEDFLFNLDCNFSEKPTLKLNYSKSG